MEHARDVDSACTVVILNDIWSDRLLSHRCGCVYSLVRYERQFDAREAAFAKQERRRSDPSDPKSA